MSTRDRRHPLLTTMGTLNLMFGFLGLLCGAVGIGAYALILAMAKNPSAPGREINGLIEFMETEAPGWLTIEIAKPTLVILLGVLLIVAGIGLLLIKSWGRYLSIAFAVTSIFLHSGYVAYEFGIVRPATERFQRTQATAAAPSPATSAGTSVGVLFAAGLWIVYSGGLLTAMVLPATGKALRPRKRRRQRRYYEGEDDIEERNGADEDVPLRQVQGRRRPPEIYP